MVTQPPAQLAHAVLSASTQLQAASQLAAGTVELCADAAYSVILSTREVSTLLRTLFAPASTFVALGKGK